MNTLRRTKEKGIKLDSLIDYSKCILADMSDDGEFDVEYNLNRSFEGIPKEYEILISKSTKSHSLSDRMTKWGEIKNTITRMYICLREEHSIKFRFFFDHMESHDAPVLLILEDPKFNDLMFFEFRMLISI